MIWCNSFVRVPKKSILFILLLWMCGCVFIFKFLAGNHVKRSEESIENFKLANEKDYSQENLDLKPQEEIISGEVLDHLLNVHPQVDETPEPDEMSLLLKNLSNIPNANWIKMKKYQKLAFENNELLANTCKIVYPSPYELKFNNIYWQFLDFDSVKFYFYNSYYDDRRLSGPVPKVRILAMINRTKPPPLICQFWYRNLPAPLLAPVGYTFAWHRKWGNFVDGVLQPFIMTCELPQLAEDELNKKLSVPISVSLVKNPCDNATNNLRINNLRPKKVEEFAVCVKGLDFLFTDLSVRLVEWIELLRALGTSKIFFYNLESHPNITRVLKYYEQQGFVDVTEITLPGSQPNVPGFRHLYLKKKLTHKRQNEIIPYNDCLYRNLNSFKYLVLLDIDEIIMPKMHQNWSELMQEVERRSLAIKNISRASYNVRNVYFFDDFDDENETNINHEPGIPPYLHMMQHVHRSSNFTKPGQYVKSFHSVDLVLSLHNHFPLNCFGSCTTYPIDTSLAQLQHYRKDCVGTLKPSCRTNFRLYTVRDTTIFRYKDLVVEKVTRALTALGFFT